MYRGVSYNINGLKIDTSLLNDGHMMIQVVQIFIMIKLQNHYIYDNSSSIVSKTFKSGIKLKFFLNYNARTYNMISQVNEEINSAQTFVNRFLNTLSLGYCEKKSI